jgi:hypothetical protein
VLGLTFLELLLILIALGAVLGLYLGFRRASRRRRPPPSATGIPPADTATPPASPGSEGPPPKT